MEYTIINEDLSHLERVNEILRSRYAETYIDFQMLKHEHETQKLMLQRLECILRERDLEIADLKTQRKHDRDHHSLILQAQDDQILELRNKLLDSK